MLGSFGWQTYEIQGLNSGAMLVACLCQAVYAMRLICQTGPSGLLVSSLNCYVAQVTTAYECTLKISHFPHCCLTYVALSTLLVRPVAGLYTLHTARNKQHITNNSANSTGLSTGL